MGKEFWQNRDFGDESPERNYGLGESSPSMHSNYLVSRKKNLERFLYMHRDIQTMVDGMEMQLGQEYVIQFSMANDPQRRMQEFPLGKDTPHTFNKLAERMYEDLRSEGRGDEAQQILDDFKNS